MTFDLPSKTCKLWQIRIVFAFVFIFALFAFILPFTKGLLIIGLVLFVVSISAAFLYVPFYFKSYKIKVEDNAIIVTKGIFFKSTNIMPYPRLVFAQSLTTPFARLMNMRCIILKAARGWILIPEIEATNADYLLDNLKIRKND